MTVSDAPILTAALAVYVRYGPRRATMADVAREAGVSRQTLYDHYGDKEGLIAAVVGHVAAMQCARLAAELPMVQGLGPRLDAFFRVMILEVFDMAAQAPDAEDLLSRPAPALRPAVEAAEAQKRALLRRLLADCRPGHPALEAVTDFVHRAASGAKHEIRDRDVLVAHLTTLRAAAEALLAPAARDASAPAGSPSAPRPAG